MTVARATGSKGRADRLFSLIIKQRADYRCEHCGAPSLSPSGDNVQLQTAHIHSRRFPGTRCDLDNAFCLCAACHRMFTDRPTRFAAFVAEHRSFRQMLELDRKSQPGTKPDWDRVADELEQMWRTMNSGPSAEDGPEAACSGT